LIRLPGGGLLFDRRQPPLTRRHVVYYCSALYIPSSPCLNPNFRELVDAGEGVGAPAALETLK
jgi:hypothetical protein